MKKKRILVAALNWGLGHAARCIPIIKELQKFDFEPVLASDGAALELFRLEFPKLIHIELPTYDIQYSEKGENLKWKLLKDSPKILKAIKAEKKLTRKIVKEYGIEGIISDNRFGVRSSKLKKNIFITHQLKVLSGNTTFLSSYIHHKFIGQFEQCWIPDVADAKNLSGILGHQKIKDPNIKYIGILSRFEKTNPPEVFDYLILLSGPEPQRTLLENILLKEIENSDKKILFIRGVFDESKTASSNPNVLIKNHLYGRFLQEALNSSKIIISRSGYSTLMDLSQLEKKVFFIPTPGQPEQEYLAERLEKMGVAPFVKQDAFKFSLLKNVDNYSGLRNFSNSSTFGDLFSFFHSE
ncbi:glycosyltransferase [Gramella sp. AN32]|uniref:Glycosyltransferase n=1 Tax=Christiangramia antarctica TaxID=2058158 RepID=A0ABW5X9M2_9FLAO|nr:glycosyltransferase [Gramella sp. AN32]MCM4155398.1 glycosyltransferase [Gramella sp. AN32]